MNLTYNEAYQQLSTLVEQIEDNEIQLDTLAEKVAQAKELITFCEIKLRTIDTEVTQALGDSNPDNL